MTHDPYCHASNGSPSWTSDEDEAIKAFRAQGMPPRSIHMKMPHRTEAAIKNRLTVLKTGLDEVRKRQRQRRASRRKEFPINHIAEPPIVVPAKVLEDRERRASSQRSLTALIFGDPEPGRVRL